jgi:hypothetical protein
MTTLLFSNDASTTLQSGIGATWVTATLAAGTGSLFPDPAAGQAYFTTFLDASTQQTKEIVLVTARTGDTITLVRGQQGTTPRAWNAGDLVAQLVTAGDSEAMVQPDQLQSAIYSSCVAGGTANSLTGTLNSGLTQLPNLMTFTIEAAAANTGPATLTLTLGSTVLPAHNILKYGGSALNAGDIPAAGFPIELVWVAALTAYVMVNPASGTAGSVAGGAANDVLIQTAPGTTGFVSAPTIAGQVLAFVGGIIQWVAAAVTSFNGRSGAVVPQTGDYTPAQVAAVAASAFNAPNKSLSQPGFAVLPGGSSAGGDGMIFQCGTRAISPNTATAVPFPKIFPNACLSVVVSCNNQGAALEVDGFTTTSFNVRVNATQISWIAAGY